MVSERDIEQIINNTTSDGNHIEETATNFSVVVAAAVDARINAAMDEWLRRLQKMQRNIIWQILSSCASPETAHTLMLEVHALAHPIQTPPPNQTVPSLMFPFGCSAALPMTIAMVLTKLNLPLGLRLACWLDILCTNEVINASIHLHVSTLLPWMSPL